MNTDPEQTTVGSGISRRDFMDDAVISSSAFMVVPYHVLGYGGATPSSEKLNIAGIGVGGQRASNISQFPREVFTRKLGALNL